ncbi:MAG: protease inhibitor I42 family protein [Paludibacteraceae bacterium]|nr:protease inhibitor I42 family protein [Paludibacteraceae bacterium]
MKKFIKTTLAFISAISMIACSQVQGGRMDRRKIVKDTTAEEVTNSADITVAVEKSKTSITLSQLNYFDGDKEFNDTIKLNLASLIIPAQTNPSTGYDWEVRIETQDSSVLKLDTVKNTTKRDPSQPMMCGAPSTREYEFTFEKAGFAKIIFEYKRPWEKKNPETTVVYNITIEE